MKGAKGWAIITLRAAGVYNLVWGAWVVLFPLSFFNLVGMPPPEYPELWQCIGMIVGVYGVGYLIAASDPLRHWPIVLVGFLGKLFGPIGFAGQLVSGKWPIESIVLIIFNDLIWWIPFGAILYLALKHHTDPLVKFSPKEREERRSWAEDKKVGFLKESAEEPVLLVFLRHSGCCFANQMIQDLRDALPLPSSVKIKLITMSQEAKVQTACERLDLKEFEIIRDQTGSLFRLFGLPRGEFLQLFGPKVWLQAMQAVLVGRNFLGALDGDGFQMSGAFLLQSGTIENAQIHGSAGERTRFEQLFLKPQHKIS